MDGVEFSSLASGQQIKGSVDISTINLENILFSNLPLGSSPKVSSNANIKISQFFSIIIHAALICGFLSYAWKPILLFMKFVFVALTTWVFAPVSNKGDIMFKEWIYFRFNVQEIGTTEVSASFSNF